DLRWLRLSDGDRLLLCSDGLNEMVDDASIAEILSRYDDPRAAAHHLLEEALHRGGKDNVTVVVARYRLTGGDPVGVDFGEEEPGVRLDSKTDSGPVAVDGTDA